MDTSAHRVSLRVLLGVLATAFTLASAPARGTSTAHDISDSWWNPAESGWGVQFVQQHETVFATLYVYRPDKSRDFYVAVLGPTSPFAWTGTVYRTTGPWFGGPFNPAEVAETAVGSMTFTLKSFYYAELAYVIDGVPVTKTIERMSFANDQMGGNYFGAATATTLSGPCASTGPVPVVVQFVHTGGASFTGQVATPASTCTMNGTYSQRGRYGDVFGSYTCTNGETGNVSLTDIAVGSAAVTFHYRFNGTGPGYSCEYEGDFGGARG
ncbi:MAG: hypothetical protein IT519_07955 [Burkholderiales bacterium]|jgi:hypothetical protein|nr:hypothetical protein [Burkholderiales bacterium]